MKYSLVPLGGPYSYYNL